jgi:HAD superfamily hydrolase (TIGR01450 family)
MPLADAYAGVVLDIDGVLCRGEEAVPGAAQAVAALRERGGVALLTNNASRTPAQVAAWLGGMGIAVADEEVVSSPVAAAALVAPGTRCLVIGMDGLREALAARGARVVTDPGAAEAVVVGFDRHLVYDDLRRAALALQRDGVAYLATNADRTFPAADGLWPGNGAVLAALEAATGRTPVIAGKPEAGLFEAAADRLPPGPLLMVGDRIETDIRGAAALGWDTALVLTGVTAADDPRTAEATHVLPSVAALLDG